MDELDINEIVTLDLYFSTMYSGHMYRNSPYETSSSCGNCDGARCDTCKTIYEITDGYNEDSPIIYRGYDETIFTSIKTAYKEFRSQNQ